MWEFGSAMERRDAFRLQQQQWPRSRWYGKLAMIDKKAVSTHKDGKYDSAGAGPDVIWLLSLKKGHPMNRASWQPR